MSKDINKSVLKTPNRETEIDYFTNRIKNLERETIDLIDPVGQANINYEIRYCRSQIKRIEQQIKKII